MNIPSYSSLHRPVIFAHRGSSAHAPENTLAAFKLAVQQQAPAMELDAKLTSDAQVVVMHDDSVDRTTDGSGKIKSLTLSNLKKLDAGSKFSPSFRGEEIPTLAEVFEAVGNRIFINVELTNYTSPTDDLVAKVVFLVKKYGLESSVLFSSFNPIALIQARNLLPQTPVGFLTQRGFAPWLVRSGLFKLNSKVALHPEAADATPELIQAVHRVGSRVHAYTVNQPEIMQQLFSMGVDGIFTDDPLLAARVLAEM